MSKASNDVLEVVEEVQGIADSFEPDALAGALLPGLVRLILERLDRIAYQLEVIKRRV